jgi:TolB protein
MTSRLLLLASIVVTTVAALQGGGMQQTPPAYGSRVTIYDLAGASSRVVYEADTVWEAPNWSRDGTFLLSNSGGKLYRIPVDGSSPPSALAVDPSLRCNNDHDLSPDGTQIAISASSPSSRSSQIYVADADGSHARLVVAPAPSYFHGWSPDGKYLSFVANRDGKQYDLYRVLAVGGPEERLTSDPAYDDGTDYARDGKWIYFNSNRGGGWNIWRIPADGAGPDDRHAQRVTNDDLEDWFPHPSPDGKWLLFLSFPHGTEGHNDRNQRIQIRMIPMPGETPHDERPQVIVELTGGQGTINVNSWSPDSRRFAFVSYQAKQQSAGAGTAR